LKKGFKVPKVSMKAPKGLTVDKVLKAPKGLGKSNVFKSPRVQAKMPTLKDFKATVPKGGLTNKGLRQDYGKVPGLDT
jgi:hypothetical protein